MSRVDENGYRRRMKLRGPITLVVLLGLLGGSAWYGAKTVLGQDDAVVPAPVCHTQKVDKKNQPKITTKQVSVSIYNAGQSRGLATRTAAAMRDRGFVIAKVGNAADGISVAKWQVRAKTASPQAQLVAAQVKGAKIKTSKSHDGSGVDLYVGDDFEKLTSGAPRSITVKGGTVTVCTTPSATAK